MPAFSRRLTTAGWWALAVLLALVLAIAATGSREAWPGLVGDEATYLMQAQSLAWDGDLRFTAEDLERFRQRRGHSPEVILQSGDRGDRIVYGKPFLYALAVAPLVRLLGERGAVLANALALSVAGLLAALALTRQGNPAGPWWIAVALFASVAFGHVFWIHPDLFMMAAAGSGLALAHLLREEPGAQRSGGGGRGRALAWCAAGALLAIPAACRPPYLVLLLPGAFLAAGGAIGARASAGRSPAPAGGARAGDAAPAGSGAGAARGEVLARLGAFGGGVVLVAAVTLGGQQLASGSWSPYAGERRGFSELEGFPGVDFPVSEWSARVERTGNTSWLRPGALETNFSPALAGWNLTYLLFGRTVGLVPYFLPALVALLHRRPGAAARVEALAGLAVPLAFLLLRPWNFYGGAGALANRYFLPAYPMFWFTRAGPVRCALTVVLAAPFLWPLWSAPAAYPLVPGEGYRYVAPAAHLLPVESTQRHVKAPGRPDVVHGTLWVRFLDGGLESYPTDATTRLELRAGRAAEILVGSGYPLESLTVEALDAAAGALRVEGPGLLDAAGSGASRRLDLDHATARHPMWWTEDPFWLYRLEIESSPPSSGGIPLRLTATASRPEPKRP